MGMHVHNYVSPRQRKLTPEEAHVREVAYALGRGEHWAIEEAAKEMADYIMPMSSSILVPIPSSSGNTDKNKKLAQAICSIVGCEVQDILTSNQRDSQKERSKQGLQRYKDKDIKTEFKNVCDTQQPVILIDNVRTSGATINSALSILPCASYLVYAQAQHEMNWYEKARV